jgi:hypothetical protein
LASQKTGFSQETESHNIELPVAFEFEFDPRVAVYDAQPENFTLDYRNADGKRVTPPYTPDYLVVLDDGRAAIVECKREAYILKRLGQNDPRWQASAGRRYTDLAATHACGEIGLAHLTLTERDINYRLFANQRFLGLRYLYDWSPSSFADQLLAHVRDAGALWVNDLLRTDRQWTSDDVWGAVARRWLYVDLHTVALDSREPYLVYSSEDLCDAINGRSGAPRNHRAGLNVDVTSEFECHSRRAIDTALARWTRIKEVARGRASATSLNRSERKWLTAYRRAERVNGTGFVGLLPAYHRRGDRRSRLPPAVETTLETLLGRYLDPAQPRGARYYGELRTWCIHNGYTPPSKPAFYARLNKRKRDIETIQAREGADAAYQAQPASELSDSAGSRRPQRAWQLAYIDHTPLPIRCVSSRLGSPISGHVVLTIVRDGYTGEVLGFYLSYQSPSQSTILAVLWDVYRRYERLPEWLHLDGERAHDAVAVEKLLARTGVHKLARRYKKPRDGALVETEFRTLQTRLITYLQGNYVENQDPKAWDAQTGPKQQAEWTLGGLYCAIRKFFDHRNANWPQPQLGGISAEQARLMSQELHGTSGMTIARNLLDAAYVILPTTRRGEYRKFRSNSGLRVNYFPYVPVEPLDSGFDGDYGAVRYDPFDIRYCLVELRGRWHRFVLRQARQFDDLSGDFLAGVTIELIETARQCQRHHDTESAEQLASLLSSIDDLERDPLESLRRSWDDAERSAEHRLDREDVWSTIDPENLERMVTRFEDFGDE